MKHHMNAKTALDYAQEQGHTEIVNLLNNY